LRGSAVGGLERRPARDLQGCQFTSAPFTGVLEAHEVRISMDGRGRVFDNIFVERLWRTIKYEDIYLRDYPDFRNSTSVLPISAPPGFVTH